MVDVSGFKLLYPAAVEDIFLGFSEGFVCTGWFYKGVPDVEGMVDLK